MVKTSIEEKYQKKTHHEHILEIPDTYIGSVEKDRMVLWVYNKINNKIEKKEIEFVPGLYKIFDEILVNTRDQTVRDKTCKNIKINIDKNSVKVWNDGNGIDVVIHKEHNIYIPELIFGNLLTSTNYDKNEDKIVGGKNGYGAKLCNIFSSEFIIETLDSKAKKKYKQIFTNNMYNIEEPEIENSKASSYTQIIFKPDFKRFNLEEFTDDILSLMYKRVYDIAATTSKNVNVYLNDEKINIKTFDEYISYHYPEEIKETSESETSVFSLKKCKVYEEINDRWKVGVIFNPDNGYEHISFVNGISTYKGGTHVDYIVNQIVKHIIEIMKKKNKNLVLKPSQIKDNITIFIETVIVNPSFNSQTKEELNNKKDNFGSTCEISKKFLLKLEKTGLITELVEFGKLKEQSILKKTDGKKTSKISGIEKLEDANKAGTTQSSKCRLILTEGDSAKALAVAGLSVIGRNYYGVFPLKGKMLNVRDAIPKQMLNNEEIIKLKKILGLRHDVVYKDTGKLRYGGIVIFTDQDVDGSHIKGLIINFIHYFWPDLAKLKGFITCLTTPIMKVKKGNNTLDFYNVSEYNKWIKKNLSGWSKPKYYKGLGTSTSSEAREYFKDFDKKLINYVWSKDTNQKFEETDDTIKNLEIDEQKEKMNKCHDAITLAFSKIRADDRKRWLSKYSTEQFLENTNKNISYYDFINKELIHFSKDDNDRSIPSIVDGFKISKRKIHYISGIKELYKKNKEIKVLQLAGAVSQRTNYHHGENSLCGAIINMAQNYVGSNNINILYPSGQFGTRLDGGKDFASPRYTFTRPIDLASLIFRKEDFPILERVVDDGDIVEPKWYIPIIPMILVNGCDGIGTGFSTKIPNFNPIDIVNYIKNKISNKDVSKQLVPWYRNFRGHIIKSSNGQFEIRGEHEQVSKNVLEINELPIGTWTTQYKDFLEKITIGNSTEQKHKKSEIIEDFENHSTDVSVKFIIKFPYGKLDEYIAKGTLETKLKLITTKSINNMHLHSADGLEIKKYSSPEEIIDDFYIVRFDMYKKRKEYLLERYKKDLELIRLKRLFIKYVIDKKIIIFKQTKENIHNKLEELEFPQLSSDNNKLSYDYLLNIKIHKFTKEELDKLEEEFTEKETTLNNLVNTEIIDMWNKELDEFMIEYKKWDKIQKDEFIKISNISKKK